MSLCSTELPGHIAKSLADDLMTTARDNYSSISVLDDMAEEKAPKIDFKVLDAAIKKVLAHKPKKQESGKGKHDNK